MNTKLDDNVLVDMVFRCLCRVLKNRKMYHKFRCFVGICNKPINHNCDLTTNIYGILECMRPYVITAQETDNPFRHAYNKKGIFDILKASVGKENEITNENYKDVGKVQMRISQFLNMLLHCCVERTVNSFSEIECIGRDTFEMVCKKIYGDDFVDETENCIPENVKRLIDAEREYIENNGMVDPRILARDQHFIEFLKSKGIKHNNRIRDIIMTPIDFESLEGTSNYSEQFPPTSYDLEESLLDDYDMPW